jgi:F0F1-type ATP synthase membrane subunit b/b'
MFEPWIPLLSALVTGVLVKVIDHTYVKGEKSFDDAIAIRQELRNEVHSLNVELAALRQDLDRWKDAYYEQANRHNILLAECQALRAQVEELREHDDLRQYQAFQRALTELRQEAASPAEPSDGASP